jgi:hypothetical protein
MQTGTETVTKRYASMREAQLYSGLSIDTLERLEREGKLSVFRPRAGKRLVDLRQLDEVIRESAASA